MGEDDELMTKHFERWQKFGNAEIRNTKYGNTEMPKYTVNIYRCPPERYRRSKIQQQMQADDRTRSSSHPIIPGSTSENTVPGKPFLVGREKWKNGTKERNAADHEVDSKFPGISFPSLPLPPDWRLKGTIFILSYLKFVFYEISITTYLLNRINFTTARYLPRYCKEPWVADSVAWNQHLTRGVRNQA